jgi:hypothetical protein
MDSGFSVTDAAAFQDYSGRVGLSNQNTASSRKAAVVQILGNLEPEEQQDVRNIDLDLAFTKWVNKSSTKYTPASMQVYQSRMKTAIADFIRYKADPTAYKPSTPPVSRTNSAKAPAKERARDTRDARSIAEQSAQTKVASPGTLTFSVPIRQGVTATLAITGIPAEFTAAEAARTSKLVTTLLDTMLAASAAQE